MKETLGGQKSKRRKNYRCVDLRVRLPPRPILE
jgi:hypothetical protein